MVLKAAMKAITGNRLRDGAVVFLTSTGDWSPDVNRSAVASDEAAERRLLGLAADAERRQLVVGTYAIDVDVLGRMVRPVRYREMIRATGPSVAYGQRLALPSARWEAA